MSHCRYEWEVGPQVVSSKRFKEEIKPMDKASEAILSLEPVTFRYKHELDPVGVPQFRPCRRRSRRWLILIWVGAMTGKAYTVRYEAVNAMLLNEFLKAHRKVAEQDRKVRNKKQ